MRFWSVFVWLCVLCLTAHSAVYCYGPPTDAWMGVNFALGCVTCTALATLLELREQR